MKSGITLEWEDIEKMKLASIYRKLNRLVEEADELGYNLSYMICEKEDDD